MPLPTGSTANANTIGIVELACIAAVEDDLSTMFGEALGEREADALRRSGNERPLASQVE